jgi:hypothetical protein
MDRRRGVVRHALKIDENQPEIIKALKAACISVEVIGKPVDLLTWAPATCPHCHGVLPDGKTALMEIKGSDGRFTKDQVEFMARWPGVVHVARTPEEAVQLVLGKEAMK